MEALTVAANFPVRVQGVAGDRARASSSGADRRCRSFSSAGRRRGLSPHAEWKAGHLKWDSEKRTMYDGAFLCSITDAAVGGSSSSSSMDVQDEGREVRGRSSSLWTGAAALMASIPVQGMMAVHAIASESESGGNSQALDLATSAAADATSAAVTAASAAPSWLASAIVGFPLFSYFLFGLYRENIHPGAKVTDWLFTLVALGIAANIVMRAVWGVRLY